MGDQATVENYLMSESLVFSCVVLGDIEINLLVSVINILSQYTGIYYY